MPDSLSIVGTWRALEYSQILAPGDTLFPLGRNVSGYLVYDTVGHVFFQAVNSDSVAKTSNAEDAIAANRFVRNYAAFFGRYRVDYTVGTVRHQLEMELHPLIGDVEVATPFHRVGDTLWVGDSAKRHWRFVHAK